MQNPDNDRAVHGKVLETFRAQSAETNGDTQWVEERMVNHGEEPLDATFGLLESKVTNERNANKSRRTDRYMDTDDVHELTGREYDGMQALGAATVVVREKTVDITNGAAAHVESGNTIMSSEVKALDRVHGRRTTKEVTAWAAMVSENAADTRADGEATTTTEQVVAGATAWPARTINTVELTRKQIGDDKFRQVHVEADSRPTLTSYEEEPTTGLKVTVARSLSATDPAGTFGAAGVVRSVKHVAKDRWLLTTRTIDSSITSTVFYEYHPVEFSFPSYLDADEPFIILEIENNQTLINTLKSSPQRLKIPCLFEIRYYATLPTLSDTFQFKPVDISLRTADGPINENGVLTDGATITLRITPNIEILNQKFAQGTITYAQYLTMANGYDVDFEFPPSSPTTTEYLAIMGTNKLIAHDVIKWKYNLYREVKVWMKVPNLATDLSGSLIY